MMSIAAHFLDAVVLNPVGDWDGVLEVKEATVTLDESWAPYCQVDLLVVTPPLANYATWGDLDEFYSGQTWGDFSDDYPGQTWGQVITAINDDPAIAQHQLDPIDPREEIRVLLTLGQFWIYPTRDPQERTFDLVLREREIDHATGLTRIKLESDEALLIDSALVANSVDSSAVVLADSLRDVVNHVLARFGASLEAGTDDADFSSTLDALDWEPGVTAWNFLGPLVQRSGLRLFCDEMRRWWLVDANTYAVEGQINIAASTNLTQGRDKVSLYSDWYESVVVKYTYVDGDGVSHVVYDSAGEPGTKTLTVEWSRPFPGAGAAASLLARRQVMGRVFALDALSDYETTPGISLQATMPDTPAQSGIVSSVIWRFAAEGESDDMTVGSRGLIDTASDAWITAPEGLAWEDLAVGEDWTEYP